MSVQRSFQAVVGWKIKVHLMGHRMGNTVSHKLVMDKICVLRVSVCVCVCVHVRICVCSGGLLHNKKCELKHQNCSKINYVEIMGFLMHSKANSQPWQPSTRLCFYIEAVIKIYEEVDLGQIEQLYNCRSRVGKFGSGCFPQVTRDTCRPQEQLVDGRFTWVCGSTQV